ncbi:MAG TPA: class II fumarate hydratase [Vicinamibacterales bacterium]|nr:class II fumarate hydratase [Vicinamibacterales bacterium]
MSADTRLEHDALGDVAVPADRLWGAQTQRSREFFAIGVDRFRWTRPVIRALGIVKKAAALANHELGELDADRARLIERAADRVIAGEVDGEFPLVVFQTGSGTQSNMNANEVVANLANQEAGSPLGTKRPVHPNDHVNMGQSSNDAFPAVMHIASVEVLVDRLLPAVQALRGTLLAKARAFDDVIMIGRTHLQDATPIALGQVVDGWVAQIDAGERAVRHALDGLMELALGATAVGTGLNAHPRFGERAAVHVAALTGQRFRPPRNLVAALAGHEAMAEASAALRLLAGALMKTANDVRLYASGPRAGIGELRIPENEPGSSIMPGKVNPTQAEALTMVCVQVYGNDAAVAFAASQGHFQLNVYKPVILHNLLESAELLADACRSFDVHCARGLEPDRARIAQHVQDSLMLVTALAPHIGYERAAAIARHAHEHGTSLRDAAKTMGVSEDDFTAWVVPERMARPHK